MWLKGFNSNSNFAVWLLFSITIAYVCEWTCTEQKQNCMYMHACTHKVIYTLRDFKMLKLSLNQKIMNEVISIKIEAVNVVQSI